MDISLDDVIHFDVITSNPTTGAAVDADSTPTFAIYEEATDTAIVTGNFTKRTSLTGNYRGTATLSTANGFEVGKWYNVIASAVVGGVTGKAVVKTFNVVAAPGTTGGLSIVGSAMTLAANSVNSTSLAASASQKIADTTLRRTMSNVEASADGDTISDSRSLYGLVQQAKESNTVDNAGKLTVYKSDGTTELEQLTIASDSQAEPVTGVS